MSDTCLSQLEGLIGDKREFILEPNISDHGLGVPGQVATSSNGLTVS